jgi:hypothetical protein
MPKKSEKIDPEIRVKRRNLKDLIRDEIYGAGVKSEGVAYPGSKLVIPTSEVAGIAKRIAKRALIGPN